MKTCRSLTHLLSTPPFPALALNIYGMGSVRHAMPPQTMTELAIGKLPKLLEEAHRCPHGRIVQPATNIGATQIHVPSGKVAIYPLFTICHLLPLSKPSGLHALLGRWPRQVSLLGEENLPLLPSSGLHAPLGRWWPRQVFLLGE